MSFLSKLLESTPLHKSEVAIGWTTQQVFDRYGNRPREENRIEIDNYGMFNLQGSLSIFLEEEKVRSYIWSSSNPLQPIPNHVANQALQSMKTAYGAPIEISDFTSDKWIWKDEQGYVELTYDRDGPAVADIMVSHFGKLPEEPQVVSGLNPPSDHSHMTVGWQGAAVRRTYTFAKSIYAPQIDVDLTKSDKPNYELSTYIIYGIPRWGKNWDAITTFGTLDNEVKKIDWTLADGESLFQQDVVDILKDLSSAYGAPSKSVDGAKITWVWENDKATRTLFAEVEGINVKGIVFSEDLKNA
jgi:hypothetical protein